MTNPARVAPLLDLDPDLAGFLDASRAAEAHQHLIVPVRKLAAGPWNTARLAAADPGHLGLLVLDGVLSREVLASDVISTELIGAGEVLRPWQISPDASLLRVSARWNVLAEARIAVLDRRLASRLSAYPEVMSLLVERMVRRTERMAVTQAISQFNRVDQRLITLFWHLAERWGRMTPQGVAIPLTLSHRMLAQLVGARRPTVSTALAELARDEQVVRQDDGSWLLTGEPVGEPAEAVLRNVPPRRRMLAVVRAEPDGAPAELVHAGEPVRVNGHGDDGRPAVALPIDREELLARLARVREDCDRMRNEFSGGYQTTVELCRRTAELRERREHTRPRLREAQS